jgi:hypothetical protein
MAGKSDTSIQLHLDRAQRSQFARQQVQRIVQLNRLEREGHTMSTDQKTTTEDS